MSRILIDLTDLELWGGQHGGTQRVVYGIAKNFYLQQDKIDAKVEFIAFSSNARSFHTTSFEPIFERAEANKSTETKPSPQGLTLKRRLKIRLRPYIPERIRKSAKARNIALKSLQKAVAVRNTVKSTKQRYAGNSSINSFGRVDFNKGDTVLMLGKPWDDLNIQRVLTAEKNRFSFKLVQVVYDMIIPLNPQLHHPSLFTPYTQHMFEAVSASDLMLPISESTANDLRIFCDRLNLVVPPLKVIRLGDEVIDLEHQALTKPDPIVDNSFIACVGTIEIRKNHMLLYNAYKLALERSIELPQLVIVGSRGWLSGDFQYLVENDPSMQGKIIILDKINDSGLAWVYKNCLFTVYPSMYEGWGLPVAESLAYGKLCIASNSSSIPEIAGDLIDYFSPYDVNDCLDKIQTYSGEDHLNNKQLAIKRDYIPTSWADTYKQVLNAINQ